MNTRLFAMIAGAMVFGASGLLYAQAPARSIWDGVYTAAQASRGKDVFMNTCATCHGNQLEGADSAPPLAGDSFFADFSGQTLADLVDRIHTTMPADNPGRISVVTATDLAAFILSSNGVPAGSAELAPDPKLLATFPIKAKGK